MVTPKTKLPSPPSPSSPASETSAPQTPPAPKAIESSKPVASAAAKSLFPSLSLPKPTPHSASVLSTSQLLLVSRAFRHILLVAQDDRLRDVYIAIHDCLIRDVISWASEDLVALDLAVLNNLFARETTDGVPIIRDDAYRVACELVRNSSFYDDDPTLLSTVLLRLAGARVLWDTAQSRWLEASRPSLHDLNLD